MSSKDTLFLILSSFSSLPPPLSSYHELMWPGSMTHSWLHDGHLSQIQIIYHGCKPNWLNTLQKSRWLQRNGNFDCPGGWKFKTMCWQNYAPSWLLCHPIIHIQNLDKCLFVGHDKWNAWNAQQSFWYVEDALHSYIPPICKKNEGMSETRESKDA